MKAFTFLCLTAVYLLFFSNGKAQTNQTVNTAATIQTIKQVGNSNGSTQPTNNIVKTVRNSINSPVIQEDTRTTQPDSSLVKSIGNTILIPGNTRKIKPN